MFTALMIFTYAKLLPSLAKKSLISGDYTVFAVFFFGAHAQMLFSAVYHLFNAYSATISKRLLSIELSLIVLGSEMACKIRLHGHLFDDCWIIFPTTLLHVTQLPPWYALSCLIILSIADLNPDLMTVHLVVISLLGVVGVLVSGLPKLQGPEYRTFRAVFFIIFGLYVLIPLPHMVRRAPHFFVTHINNT